jgi:hypothetical protein
VRLRSFRRHADSLVAASALSLDSEMVSEDAVFPVPPLKSISSASRPSLIVENWVVLDFSGGINWISRKTLKGVLCIIIRCLAETPFW